jgi:hypothetical protein
MEKVTVHVQSHDLKSQRMVAKPDPKALAILAKSIFRELRAQGYEPTQIVGLATEILSLVTSDIAGDSDSTP